MALLVALTFSSCSDDKDDETIDNLPELIQGEWLDLRGQGNWTEYDFLADGTLEVSQWGDTETYRGVYACAANHISGAYHGSMGFDWDVTGISAYYVRYIAANANAENTIYRILNEMVMHVGESAAINISTLVPGTNVTQYSVANTDIAVYDQANKQIKALAPGETFVTMLTEMGTVAVRIVVTNNIVEPN